MDWLLSEEDFDSSNQRESIQKNNDPSWIDKLPKHLHTMIKRYGWLAGLYIIFYGASISIVGFLARMMFKKLNRDPFDPAAIINNPGWRLTSTVTAIIIIIGILVIIAGCLLTLFLKKWSKKS